MWHFAVEDHWGEGQAMPGVVGTAERTEEASWTRFEGEGSEQEKQWQVWDSLPLPSQPCPGRGTGAGRRRGAGRGGGRSYQSSDQSQVKEDLGQGSEGIKRLREGKSTWEEDKGRESGGDTLSWLPSLGSVTRVVYSLPGTSRQQLTEVHGTWSQPLHGERMHPSPWPRPSFPREHGIVKQKAPGRHWVETTSGIS